MHSNGQSMFFKCPNLSKRQLRRRREKERTVLEERIEIERDQLTETGF